MRELTKGEAANRRISTSGKVVTVVHTVKPSDDSQSRYELTWKFDFADLSEDQLCELAVKPMLIRKQADWRKANNRMDGKVWDNQTFSVKEILENVRQAADPVTKAANTAKKMTAEQRKALLAELQAMDESEE